MNSRKLTVLVGGNPDDNFAETHRSHLKFVPTSAPVEAPAQRPASLSMRIIDDLIVTLVRWQHSLEMFRVWLEWRSSVPRYGSVEQMVSGRGW